MSTFEECYDRINTTIAKRRSKWTLHAINWMSWEDVAQELRSHIHQKWYQYNEKKGSLEKWLNRIISNQIYNILRNKYYNYVKPCSRCPLALEDDGCRAYGKQSVSCTLFANWLKRKKSAYDTKLPLPMENHIREIFDKPWNGIDVDAFLKELCQKLPTVLKEKEWKVFELLYIKGLSEAEVGRRIGFKSKEKDKNPGYKQINNIKKVIIYKIKKMMKNNDFDYV